ncbi:MAG: HigA family addiction module antidote protein [Anaerolineae bacterium]|nr:HigA family addiction module antidote protein [Anaerolineae bacterium]
MKNDLLKPIHPGEILLEEFLIPMSISPLRLAEEISLPVEQLEDIVKGTQAITSNISTRLSNYFGLSERFWLNIKHRYEMDLKL